jgi:hypothetical protein
VLDFTLARGTCLSEADFGNVQLMDWKAGCLEIASQQGFGEEFLTFFQKVTTQAWFGVCSCTSKPGADRRRGRHVGYRICVLPRYRVLCRFSRGSIDADCFEQRGVDRDTLDSFPVAARAK